MVDRLKANVAMTPSVEAALRSVPRHAFLPGIEPARVYSGDVIVTRTDERGQAISSSSQVGIMVPMLEHLAVAPGMRVLEIGAGTGYNAALLDEIVGPRGSVVTIELEAGLADEARGHLHASGHGRVEVICSDGWAGDPAGRRFDRIVLTASTADISPAWMAQLEEGGRIVLPLRFRASSQAVVAFRKEGAQLRSVALVPGGFMDLRGPNAAPSAAARAGERWIVPGALSDRVLALLEQEPRAELGPAWDWSAAWTLGIVSDVMISSDKQPASFGVYLPEPEGLALVQPTYGAATGPRALFLSYGAPAALDRLRAAVREASGRSLTQLRVHAVPAGSRPDGSVLIERENYTFGVSLA